MILVNSVTKRYGSTLAVDDLSFQVRSGTVLGLLGPNGAGKTT
ncbi:MAG: ATP-binding cassette domain-containing protein, partial [Actinomycetota bacterium]|nr:ATP-binding cassette domain-containing protein [Actinomycetota bacterium]